MTTRQTNSFQFANTRVRAGLTVLNAVMSDFAYGRHAHEEFALGVTLDGVQEFFCQGKRFRSFPGNIILFNPGDVHDGHPGKGTELKYTMLYLDPGEFLPLFRSAGSGDAIDCRIRETHFQDQPLQFLILKMARLIIGKSVSGLEYEDCLYEMAKRLTQRMGLFHPDGWTHAKDAALVKAQAYIHDNLAEDLSVDDLSRVANISKYHFIRLFRSQFGLTPHKYILNQRINRVRDVLRTGLPPTDAAQDFGFFDASHMNRHFKKAYGLTPKQYQDQLRK